MKFQNNPKQQIQTEILTLISNFTANQLSQIFAHLCEDKRTKHDTLKDIFDLFMKKGQTDVSNVNAFERWLHAAGELSPLIWQLSFDSWTKKMNMLALGNERTDHFGRVARDVLVKNFLNHSDWMDDPKEFNIDITLAWAKDLEQTTKQRLSNRPFARKAEFIKTEIGNWLKDQRLQHPHANPETFAEMLIHLQ